MIHAMGAMHAALRAKSKRQDAPNKPPAKMGPTGPKAAAAEKPARRKD